MKLYQRPPEDSKKNLITAEGRENAPFPNIQVKVCRNIICI